MKSRLPSLRNRLLPLGLLLLTARSGSADQAVDPAAAQSAVRRADAAWSAAASAGAIDAWMTFYAPDAVVLPPNEPLASRGSDIRRMITTLLALPHVTIGWHSTQIEVAQSGEMAYLLGAYELQFEDAHGTPVKDRGKLLEIWRRQPDGAWKCSVDAWNSDGPPAAGHDEAVARVAPPPAEAAPAMPQRATSTDYGDMPTHYEESIHEYFQKYLVDPASAQYREISKPEQGYVMSVTGMILAHETRRLGWTVRATINARNSAGGYVGFKTYTFLFRGEKIVHTTSPLAEGEIK